MTALGYHSMLAHILEAPTFPWLASALVPFVPVVIAYLAVLSSPARLSAWQAFKQVAKSGMLLLYCMYLLIACGYHSLGFVHAFPRVFVGGIALLLFSAMLFGWAFSLDLLRDLKRNDKQHDEEESYNALWIAIVTWFSLAFFLFVQFLAVVCAVVF